jgi:chromosome partitioning protein
VNRPIIAFFNNKGGVGKTSLVYHLAWMLRDLGHSVLAADLDPQSNLSSAFISEDQLENLWNDEKSTIFNAIQPLSRGKGDILSIPHIETIEENLSLLVGDLKLSSFEDELSTQWPKCLSGDERAFRVITAFWRVIQNCMNTSGAQVTLLDLGPNLGAINRAALVASDSLVVPLAPDLFSLQGLRNLGPTVIQWRQDWKKRLQEKPNELDFDLPVGGIKPLGYIVMQHAKRGDRTVKAYDRWLERIPSQYQDSVLNEKSAQGLMPDQDPNCLGLVKHFRSLVPMAQESRKPMFYLKSADGAIGSHGNAVQEARGTFEKIASELMKRCRA